MNTARKFPEMFLMQISSLTKRKTHKAIRGFPENGPAINEYLSSW
jgi:hypothetical protein